MSQSTTSECRSWRSIADLLVPQAANARLAFIGAPQSEKSLTPGRCDLAPKALRDAARRFSVYDVETGADLAGLRINDLGDLPLKLMAPEQSFASVRDAIAQALKTHRLTIIAGGNNAITRPGVHGLGPDLSRIGLITLDAHFDLRDTDCGLNNGNPVRALLEDRMPGANIVQIGLAPFANTRRMHDKALSAGIRVHTASECHERGTPALVAEALERLSLTCDAIYIDFDIDVIDRSACPGAPGARPGGIPTRQFFASARLAAAHPKVRAVDLTEFDPSLDVGDVTALTAGRWLAEILAGAASETKS